MTWNCLLVDDEPPALRVLEKYIVLVDNLELVACCHNAFQAMEVLQTKKIDLLFLDIQMPQLSGTSFLKTLSQPPKVIFTTAYKEFASEAFDLDAVDYLVKPVSLERFLKAVNKVTNAVRSIQPDVHEPAVSGFLYFRSERKMVKVFLAEIRYIESIRDYIKIYREHDKPLLVKQSMATLEAMLPRDMFLRVHRSFVVSIHKITAFTKKDVELGTTEIPIGRLYAAQVKDAALKKQG